MKTTWDIIDKLEPSVQITEQKKNKPATSGSACSVVRIALVLTVAVASSGSGKFLKQSVAFNNPIHLQKKASKSVSSSRGVAHATDTQRGQSSAKLARSFPAFFQPAAEEDDYEDDYSFA